MRPINGSFTLVVANLPPTSRPAPAAYGWSDTTVTPGNFYEYHIEAVTPRATTTSPASTPPRSRSSRLSRQRRPAANGHVFPGLRATGAVTYNVYRGTTAGGESATPIATGITTTSYTDIRDQRKNVLL